MPPSVSVGIHVPSSTLGALVSGEAYAEFFRQVEALDLDAVWTEDRIFHDANMPDPLMLLASAAACTRRIELGTAVLVLTLRAAAVVARQASTLHHLSGGRLALGVSLGGRPEEYAGELADGWIMSPFGTVRDFPRLWGTVQDAARAAGRNPDALVAGRLLYVAVDDDRGRAREALRVFLHGYYGTRFDVDQHAVFGPPREVATRLIEHVDAGITKLMLGVPSLDLAHLHRLATEVAPALRARSAVAR